MKKKSIVFEHLGQTGLFIKTKNLKILIDPYLSNSVEEIDSNDLKRLIPIPYSPNELDKIDFVLITHNHLDHCDPKTIPQIFSNNPKVKFIGPSPVRKLLDKWGIPKNSIIIPSLEKIKLKSEISLHPIPAAHPQISYDIDNVPNCLGWLLEFDSKKIYIAGDTSLCQELIDFMKKFNSIDIGLLPVNEDNYYRRRRGIVGNMSIREAFQFAIDINIKKLIPVHWDLFEANSVSPDEIKAVYNHHNQLPFDLVMSVNDLSIK